MPDVIDAAVRTRILGGFDDPAIGRGRWNELVLGGDMPSPYLTWEFQRAWWETLGEHDATDLLLIVAECAGEPLAIAPLYVDSRYVFFVGASFEFDYLDFIGELSPGVLEELLTTARAAVHGFRGFSLHFVSDRSSTAGLLATVAPALGLSRVEGHEMLSCAIGIADKPEAALAAAGGRHALKAERWFERQGPLTVTHLRDGWAIRDQLPAFFQQHCDRYAGEDNPSRFRLPEVRRLFERFTELAADAGTLRFTRIDVAGEPIAFHYGYALAGRHFFGPCSFRPELARRSPGKVLLRQLLLAAIEEGAEWFDFGTGDQDFKRRHATDTTRVREWSLEPGEEED
jgi:CelD/BcsL family acetyltransferase involved in cellulose biosynthesis